MGVFVRRYIDFLILPIPTPLVSVLFCNSMFILLNCFSFFYIKNIFLNEQKVEMLLQKEQIQEE